MTSNGGDERRAVCGRVRAAPAAVRRSFGDDRGSGAGAMLIFAVLFMALVGFVVDGGMSISKRERAADIAEQAARYAAQDVDVEKIRQGKNAPINFENCPQRVAQFAKRSGLTGPDIAASGCLSANTEQVRVRVRLTYEPVLTGMFYSAPLEVYGQATAESVTG